MSEEIDKHVFRKYEVQSKLGKGVRLSTIPPPLSSGLSPLIQRPDLKSPTGGRSIGCGARQQTQSMN